MSALKKKIISHNISNFREGNLLVFFFNHNHITIEEWRIIKSELSKIIQVNTLYVKNQIANKVIIKSESQQACIPFLSGEGIKGIGGSLSTFDNSKNKISTLLDLNAPCVLSLQMQYSDLRMRIQGPTLLMGVTCIEKCQQVFTITKKQKKLIFVGAIYQGQFINHLEFDYLLKVQKVAYPTLVWNLQSNLYLDVITTPLIRLCHLLGFYKESILIQKEK